MDWGALVFCGVCAIFAWVLVSAFQSLCGKLDNIISELRDIKYDVSGIYEELKWSKDNSSASRIIKRLEGIEEVIKTKTLHLSQ